MTFIIGGFVKVKILVVGEECELDFPPNTKVSEVMWAARGATRNTRNNGERGWQMFTESGEWCLLDDPINKYIHDMPLGLILKAGTGG